MPKLKGGNQPLHIWAEIKLQNPLNNSELGHTLLIIVLDKHSIFIEMSIPKDSFKQGSMKLRNGVEKVLSRLYSGHFFIHSNTTIFRVV